MTSKQIEEFLSKIDEANRKASGNSKTRIFTERARNLIVAAYEKYHTSDAGVPVAGEWTARKGADTTKADELVEMGFEQAIYGKGRFLLQK